MFWRFLLVGGIGFLVDAGLTTVFMASGWSPYLARPPAIALAMCATWLLNRSYAFRASNKASVVEAGKYATVALLMALLNYLAYSLMVWAGMMPLAAIVLATALQAVASYWGYRKLVFVARATR